MIIKSTEIRSHAHTQLQGHSKIGNFHSFTWLMKVEIICLTEKLCVDKYLT